MRFNKTKTLALALCAVFLSSACTVLPVKAATAFDPSYYFSMYPDVAVVIGFHPEELYNHYVTVGMAEGRFPNSQAEWRAAAGHVDTAEEKTAFLMQIPSPSPENADSTLPKFDPIYYYNTYPDVAEVIGRDAQALLNHYFAYGYSEGRLPYYGADPCTEVQTSF